TAAGTPLKVVWYAGGHDGGEPGAALQEQIGGWVDYHLRRGGHNPRNGFDYPGEALFGTPRGDPPRTGHAPGDPGLDAPPGERRALPLHGVPQVGLRPPGASPAALSSLPGLSTAAPEGASALIGLAMDPPGQAATFRTDPMASPLEIAGAPQIRLRVA